ncbi:MAG TPA: M13 family metallopeptidase, partial [Thermomicrobiales bacterium]|nr:M13 family metallopeptidase [Thermomicrobiales bacterium]
MKDVLLERLAALMVFVTLVGSGGQIALGQTPEASPAATPFASPVASPAAAAKHGIKIEDMDLSVDPGEDFYQFANGGWLASTELPSDSPRYGTFDEIDDLVTGQLDTLVADLPADPSTDTGKVKTVYNQALDMATRDAQGVAPIRPLLDRFGKIATIDDGIAYQEKEARLDGMQGILNIYGGPSFTDATKNVAYLGSPVLSLPSLDFYLDDSADYESIRQAWVETTAKLLVQAGYSEADATSAAKQVLAFETAEAKIMTTPQEYSADPSLYSTETSVADLEKLFPEFYFRAWLDTLGLTGVDTLAVDDIKFFTGLAAVLKAAEPTTIGNLLAVELLWSAAPYLTTEIGNIAFSFNGPILNGVSVRRPANERALTLVETYFPDAVSQAYVAEAFPPSAKAQIEDLVKNIIAAYRQRILSSTWMSDETKQKAVTKLDLISVKIGYPDKWISYATVPVGDSLIETINNAANFANARNLSEIGKPVDRTEWSMGAFEVNAYYNPQGNEIVFPAAILQPPFFDPEADAASNYGAIGAVIGHEITHGFDQSGSQFDGYGNLNSWWTDQDRAAFDALNQKVIDQYDQLEALPGLYVDGELTVTENVA